MNNKVVTHSRDTNLRNEEVCEDEASNASRTPDEKHLRLQTGVTRSHVNKERSRIGDSPIPEPVGGCRQCHTLGPNVKREDLSNDDPGDGSPRGSEEGL